MSNCKEYDDLFPRSVNDGKNLLFKYTAQSCQISQRTGAVQS